MPGMEALLAPGFNQEDLASSPTSRLPEQVDGPGGGGRAEPDTDGDLWKIPGQTRAASSGCQRGSIVCKAIGIGVGGSSGGGKGQAGDRTLTGRSGRWGDQRSRAPPIALQTAKQNNQPWALRGGNPLGLHSLWNYLRCVLGRLARLQRRKVCRRERSCWLDSASALASSMVRIRELHIVGERYDVDVGESCRGKGC